MWTCPKCGEKIEGQFDSCWKCAASPQQVELSKHRLTASFFLLALVMAVLAPALADCIHSASVVSRGIRLYNAPLEHISSLAFWNLLAIRAMVTFLVIWFFARLRFGHIFVWVCLVILWLWVGAQMDVAIR